MPQKYLTDKARKIRKARIKAVGPYGVARRLIEIWNNKGWLYDGEKEELETIADEKEADQDYEPLSNTVRK